MDHRKLSERVTLQQKSVTKNGIGEELVTWADIATVWAEVIPLRGREFFAANQIQQAADIRVRIRERAGLTPDLRLVWKSQPYDITGLIPGTGPYRGLTEILALGGVRNGR